MVALYLPCRGQAVVLTRYQVELRVKPRLIPKIMQECEYNRLGMLRDCQVSQIMSCRVMTGIAMGKRGE